MSNFKRHRQKNARAGCLFCKPHKRTGEGKDKTPPNARRRMAEYNRERN